LVKYLKDKDVAVRLDAAVALQEIGEEPNLVVPALMENLKDPDAKVRMITAIALGSFGERSKTAIPKILKIMEESKADELGKSKLLQALLQQAVHNINPAAAERFFFKGEQ
jgi:HEAT repeat protein